MGGEPSTLLYCLFVDKNIDFFIITLLLPIYMSTKKILVIEDDLITQKIIEKALVGWGFEVIICSDGREGVEKALLENPQIVLTDYQIPFFNGIEVIQKVKEKYPNTPIVLMTAYDEMQLTIKAIQAGAYDYIEKPINIKKLKSIIDTAVSETNHVKLEINQLETKSNFYSGVNLIGKSELIRDVIKKIGLVSNNRVSVLIKGETGTGKEVVSRIIHESGVTRNRPFVAVNCSALAETLLESELFGHVKGAFTDAVRDKAGKFELANEGTIFLDEISEISPNIQLKLLRVIQENEFERVGGEKTLPMKARIIAASNKSLEELVVSGRFRQDLFYRLNVFTIDIPTLRDRISDLPLLVDFFIHKSNKTYSKNIKHITKDALDLLSNHPWPGNIRELEHTITRAMLVCNSDTLDKNHLNLSNNQNTSISDYYNVFRSIKEVEKEHIEKVLEAMNWQKEKAAKVLEISRPTLNQKIELYGLTKN